MITRKVLGTLLGGLLAVILMPARGKSEGPRSELRASNGKNGVSGAVVTAPADADGPRRARDPFRELYSRKMTVSSAPVSYPTGKRGLVISQLKLTGVARAADGNWIAIVDNNNSRRAYFLHSGDRLFDGAVLKVLQDRIVFIESPAELPGRTNSREVVKRLAGE